MWESERGDSNEGNDTDISNGGPTVGRSLSECEIGRTLLGLNGDASSIDDSSPSESSSNNDPSLLALISKGNLTQHT